MRKRALIVLMAGLNVCLLTALVIVTGEPQANAQAAPMGQNYAMVCGEIRNGMDALYLIDLSRRRMHVFVPNRDQNNRRLLVSAQVRDLQRDFRGGN